MRAKLTRTRILLLACCVGIAACTDDPVVDPDAGVADSGAGGDGGGGGGVTGGGASTGGGAAGGGAGSVPLSGFCAAYAEASCDYLLRCGVVGDRDRCLTSVAWTCPTEECPTVRFARASVAAGRQAYDAGAAGECFAAARTRLACGRQVLLDADPSCEAIFTGQVPTQGVCFNDEDCADDAFCSSDTKTCPSTCQPRRGVGATVERRRECQSGLVDFNTKCAEPLGVGGDCLKGICGPGLSCVVNAEGGRCAPLGGLGATCQPLGQGCAAGLVCVSSGQAAPTCQRPGSLGQSCSGNLLSDCQLDLSCGHGVDGGLTCEAARPAGAACRPDTLCAAGTRCVTTADGDGTCEALGTLGSACRRSTDCGCGLFCGGADGGTCTVRAGLGGPCPHPPGATGGPECLGSECDQGCQAFLSCVHGDAGGVCASTRCEDPAGL
jgi:hypothetical protein